MTQPINYHTVISDKHRCCQTHLNPLLERIQQLEGKILVEVERREKEYNQLLHLFLTVKRQKTRTETEPSNTQIHINKQLEREKGVDATVPAKQIARILGSRINTKKSSVNNKSKAVGSQEKGGPMKFDRVKPESNSKVVRKEDENTGSQQTKAKVKKLQIRIDETESNLLKQSSEIGKCKQLSEYLMEQLLSVYEKIRELERVQIEQVQKLQMSAIPQKDLNTQETITSIIFEADNLKHREIIKQEHNLDHLDRKINGIDSIVRQRNIKMDEAMAKISQHQSILSELIGITRGLSSKMIEIPLYLRSPYDIPSPQKQNQK